MISRKKGIPVQGAGIPFSNPSGGYFDEGTDVG